MLRDAVPVCIHQRACQADNFNAVDFWRRIVLMAARFPFLFLWMALRSHNFPCQKRLEVSQWVNRIDEIPCLESRKVFRHFEVFFRWVIANDGLCPMPLYRWALHVWSKWWQCTQMIEGANKSVTNQPKCAPRINDDLAKARVLISQAVHSKAQASGTSGTFQNNYNTVDAATLTAIQDLKRTGLQLHGSELAKSIADDPLRHMLVPPVPIQDSSHDVAADAGVATPVPTVPPTMAAPKRKVPPSYQGPLA